MFSLAPKSAPQASHAPGGLPAVAALPWGTHLCQFYRTADDLASALVPFFAAGLENGERCLWIAAEPLRAADARRALARAVPDLAARIQRGQIEIVDFCDWYLEAGPLTPDGVLARWLALEEATLRQGWQGLRITGNTTFLRPDDWADFEAYERKVHAAFGGRRILAICSYSLDRCSADQVLEVVRNHGMTLARRAGAWVVVRGATEALATIADGIPPADAAGAPHHHDAILYRTGAYPVERVARFVADGLAGGEGVVLVLGGERARAVREALGPAEVEAALEAGRLHWFDPEETLPHLLCDGAVDGARFAAVVEPLLAKLRARYGGVRACGELVDVLSRRGDFADAIALERLWNAYLARFPLPVLCTYDTTALEGAAGERCHREVRAEHRHLHPVASEPEPAPALHALVTQLAAQTQALAAEASLRSAAERERDRWQAASRDALSHVSRLQRVTSALLAARSAGELGAVVVDTMAEAMGAAAALVAAVRPHGQKELELVAMTGCPAGRGDCLFGLAPGTPIDEALASDGPTVLETRTAIERRFPGLASPCAEAFAVLPLDAGGVRRGVIAFCFEAPRAFSAADRALLDDLARQAAVALERVQLLADLERARAAAEEASRAKDEFLAMLGHELRNPLSPMVTVLHLMERRAPGTFRKERGVLERQLRHMEHLVNDLLDVSRIVRGKLVLRPEAVDLDAIVADALEAAAPLLQERRHEVQVEVAAGLGLDADRHRVVQAVVNLLTNAARYTPPGGHVAIRGESRDGRAVLSVSDDGQGIDRDLAPKVFDLFVQGPRGLARSEGGLGLGLGIVRSVAEMHGGTIRVASDGPGRGSTFTLELPLAAAAQGVGVDGEVALGS